MDPTIPFLTKGNPEVIRVMNQIIISVRALTNMVGDGVVNVQKTSSGVTLKLDIDRLAGELPKGGSAGGTTWYIVTENPVYNDPVRDRYVVQKAIEDSAGEWEGDGTDVVIERALGYEGYDVDAEDIRNWTPWYLEGAIVKVASHLDDDNSASLGKEFFLDMPMLYTGPETEASLRTHETEGWAQAVWI
jgi:hypothetical protein